MLLESTKLHLQKNGIIDRKPLLDLFGFIYPALLEAVKTESDSEVLVVGIEAIHECISVIGDNCLPKDALKELIQLVLTLILGTQSRRNRLLKSNPDGDVDDSYIIRDEILKEDDINSEIAEVIGTMVKYHRSYFLPVFQSTDLAPLVLQMAQKISPPSERQLAICIFDDLVEFTVEQSHALFPHFVPLMLEYALDPHPGVRQAACFGLGVCAQNGGAIIKPHIGVMLEVLLKAINEPDSRTDEKMTPPTENAISSVGKIIQFQADVIGDKLPNLTDLWVSWLPIEIDVVEARVVHMQLCYFIKHINSAVFGPNGKNLPKVLEIFGKIVDTELVDTEVQNTIKEILASMYKQLVPELFQGALQSISPESQLKLRNLK